MHNHLSHAFNIIIKFKQVLTIQDSEKQPNITLPSPSSSLRLKGLAQARDSRSGEPPSPRRGEQWPYAWSCLGETSLAWAWRLLTQKQCGSPEQLRA